MRSEWVPLSASALVIGAMSLVLGTVLNPSEPGASSAEALRVATEDGGRWMAMSVTYLLGSVALTLGLPAVLTLLDRRGRRTGLAGVALLVVGAIGTWGFAALMVFFRALVAADAVRPGALRRVEADPGLEMLLTGWVLSFYGGVLLLALALLLARVTPGWVPVLLGGFVALAPFAPGLGRVATALQVMALGVAFTGVALAAVSGGGRPVPLAAPVR